MFISSSATSVFAADIKYVGFKRCKGCHSYQYRAWKGFKHAQASDALDEEQKKDSNCMKCHGTGTDRGVIMEGVQCEACHGPGSRYKSPKIMSKSKYKRDSETQHKLAIEAGLVIQEENVCLQCHGPDRPGNHPPAKIFNFEEAYTKVNHTKK
jgi:hypothetical protein